MHQIRSNVTTLAGSQPSRVADAPFVTAAGAHDVGEWDAYLASKAGIGPYAAFGWGEVLQSCYGAEPVRLMAKGPSGICGIFFGYVPRSAGGSRTLYSAPIVADDPKIGRALLDAAHDFAMAKGISRSIISSGDALIETPYHHWTKTTVAKPLAAREQDAWQDLRKKTRYTIRRATTFGIVVERSAERRAEFYAAYKSRMSEKNVPFHSLSFLECMVSALGDKIAFFVAVKDGRVLGGMTFVLRGDVAAYQLNAAYSDAMSLGVNHLLMWEAMRDFIGRGIRHLDLGESTPGGGVYAFKTVQFGGIAQDVFYYDVMRGPGSMQVNQHSTSLSHMLTNRFMRAVPASWRSRWLLSQTPFGRLL